MTFPFGVVSLIRRRSQRDLKRRIASTHSIFSILPSVRPPRRLNPRILSAHSKKYILRVVQLPAASPHSGMGWHDERRRGVHVTVRQRGREKGFALKGFSPKGPIDNESLLVCEMRRKTRGLFLFPSDSLVLQELLKFHKLKSLRTSSNPI